MPKILLVDEQASVRRTLSEILREQNYQVDGVMNGKACLAALEKCNYDVIFLELKKLKPHGLEVLDEITARYPAIPVVMMSAHSDMDMEVAINAMKKHAFDVLPKPLDLNRVLLVIKNAMDKTCLSTHQTKKRSRQNNLMPEMIGESPRFQVLKSQLDKLAAFNIRVLITGPNGAGKELVARQLHYNSLRSAGPFVDVNCAAIPSELIESELFGYEPGAFTGATKQYKGRFEQADGGTLFLDEIGDMSPSAQAKVLRVLAEGKIRRLGGTKDISVDCRIIAATNRDLYQMISEAKFREDLYFRLAVVNVKVPPLNERREDIPALAQHFMESFSREYNTPAKTMSNAAMKALQEFDYRGNIRELKNIIQRVLVLGGPEIGEEDIFNLA